MVGFFILWGLPEMDKDKINSQNDQSKEEQQPSDETQKKLWEISKDELKQMLEKHMKWLDSEGKEGKEAYLVEVNLQKFEFRKANLQKALIIILIIICIPIL